MAQERSFILENMKPPCNWNYKHELRVENGILLKNPRIKHILFWGFWKWISRQNSCYTPRDWEDPAECQRILEKCVQCQDNSKVICTQKCRHISDVSNVQFTMNR